MTGDRALATELGSAGERRTRVENPSTHSYTRMRAKGFANIEHTLTRAEYLEFAAITPRPPTTFTGAS